MGGGNPDVRQVSVSEDLVTADHHVLFLDLLTAEAENIPPIKKYTMRGLTEKEWEG